jgi:hypothetical protein
MTALLKQQAFIDYMEKNLGKKLDLSNPKVQKFISELNGDILMLIPAICSSLVQFGLEDDMEVTFHIIGAYGAALTDTSKTKLNEHKQTQGVKNENSNKNHDSNNVHKLRYH